jgi:colanic acid/amylovoran biosynthesis glycosyltransferase
MKQNNFVVVHSFHTWLPQTQTWMYNQAKYLPDNVEVHIACERTQNLDQFGVPNLHCLRDISATRYLLQKAMRNLSVRSFQVHLASVVKKVGALLVHSHFGDIGWNDLPGVRKTDARHVVTFYGYDVNKLPTEDKRWLHRYRELFENADLFLCEGPYMARQLVKLGCREDKVRVQHLGVDVGNIRFQPRSWSPGTPFRVLIAAGFREKKGIPYALEALAQLQEKIPLEITIIGDAGSDPGSQEEKKRILNVIEKGGLSSKTRLLGFRPYSVLFEEAYQHHVFLSPSVHASDGDTEGGAPVSLIDMMATGMPVVSTDHCDIPGVVDYGVEGWLVPERDVDGLAERLLWLTEHTNEWENLLHVGRRHIEMEFDAAGQGKRLAKIYEEVVHDG